jgi:molecular chaperone HscA
MALLQIHEPGKSQENQDSNEVIIGIDLGTTNSLVAIIEDGKPRLLADENGLDIFPSIVSYDSGKTVISSIKRLMGKSYADVSHEKFPFKIANEKTLRILVADKKIRPEEVSAEILKKLKNIAEKNLKTEIKKAVITVPAYFDEAAKNATKLAANLINLEVVRLVNEPTAAALAYGLDNSSEGIYCVYDLGGGTFDVSILKMQKGVFKVLGVAGDNHLGGDDFDDLISNKFQIDHAAARKIKEALSTSSSLNALAFEDLMKGSSVASQPRMTLVERNFTREDFEKLIATKIDKTATLTKNLLEDLELESDEIKGVILVGGSTRIPLVRKELGKIFGAEKILTNLDPDRIVAIGAAWQAYNLSRQGENLLLDVTALSLGIEMMGGIVDKIILRNSTIPIAKAKEFTTYADNQTGMKLHIVQGERELAKDCRSLAEFEIKGIPALKAGMARVQVTFKLDADGLLTVSAQEKFTGEKQEIAVKPTFHLDQNEIKKMLLDSLQNSQADIENRLLIEAATEAMQDAIIIKKDLESYRGEDKKLIAEKLKILENEISRKASRDAILLAQQELGKAAENLVLDKVNSVLKEKIAGKNIDEV